MSALPPELVAAYRAAHYVVPGRAPLLLRVGETNPALAALLASLAVQGAAFLTTCNPGSVRLEAEENARRMRILQAEIREAGLPVINALARDPSGQWPDEASLLIPGASRAWSEALAQRHGQNGFLWLDAQGRIELVLLR
ncbi:DUF3293 domain-containing protein [Niveibacterium sp. SC-1]|uniref:DUF3293 domain-containing protein n=1 Tax=Niveibacterium sp. SC-1 TaxID=3135646 RepID=UPI00311F6E82